VQDFGMPGCLDRAASAAEVELSRWLRRTLELTGKIQERRTCTPVAKKRNFPTGMNCANTFMSSEAPCRAAFKRILPAPDHNSTGGVVSSGGPGIHDKQAK
jgi:hypothetical protein